MGLGVLEFRVEGLGFGGLGVQEFWGFRGLGFRVLGSGLRGKQALRVEFSVSLNPEKHKLLGFLFPPIVA